MTYQFLCPSCGHGFPEGTSFTKCPECQVPLLRAVQPVAAPDLRNLPDDLDLPAALREALSEQEAGDVDAAIKAALVRACPNAADALQTLIGSLLDTMQAQCGMTRREAAQQLADSKVEVNTGADGAPQIKFIAPMVRSNLQIDGLDHLLAKQCVEFEQQIEKSFRIGNSTSAPKILFESASVKTSSKPGCSVHFLLAVLALLGGILFYS